jgi:integrase
MRKNGTWEIQFRDEYRRKKTITLSGNRYKERIARQLQDAVAVLNDKKINRDPTQDRVTKAWVENAPLEIREKLARFGLYELPAKHTTGELWDTFLNRHNDMYGATQKTYLYAKDRFFLFFRPTALLDELTQERMKEWRQFLLNEGKFAPATVAGTLSKAKAVFNWAKQEHWITVSPLAGVGRGSFRNRDKDRFITREEYHRLLNACPCQEWRTIIALARIGGLHPCEILTLRWSDITKSRHRLQVFNAKLRQHERLCVREVPLFAEVATELERLRLLPGNEEQEYVINRYANREEANLGTQFARITRKAGIDRIARPFDNMRASRSTEVYHEYGAKKESLWIGHSVKVALDSYLMVTDDDYAVAAGKKVVQSIDQTEPVSIQEVMSV